MPDTELSQLYSQAVASHEAGNRPAATALCRDVLNRDPRHVDAAFLLAAIAIDDGRPADALAALDGVLALRPGDARFLHARGEACRSLGRLPEATECLLAAVQADPSLAAAHNTLGVMHLDSGDVAGAIAPVHCRPEGEARLCPAAFKPRPRVADPR